MSQCIPHKDLLKGIEITLRNVGTLIDSADLLHGHQRYLHSAIFSNLACEEMAKAQLLIDYHEKGKDLPIAEWKKLSRGGSHKKKIREYLSRILLEDPDERAKIPATISPDVILDLLADYYGVSLKGRVFYVNWIENSHTWQWLPAIYSETEQAKISASLLNVRKKYEKYMAHAKKLLDS